MSTEFLTWRATSSADWCRITPTTGDGYGTPQDLLIEITPATGYTVNDEDLTATITISVVDHDEIKPFVKTIKRCKSTDCGQPQYTEWEKVDNSDEIHWFRGNNDIGNDNQLSYTIDSCDTNIYYVKGRYKIRRTPYYINPDCQKEFGGNLKPEEKFTNWEQISNLSFNSVNCDSSQKSTTSNGYTLVQEAGPCESCAKTCDCIDSVTYSNASSEIVFNSNGGKSKITVTVNGNCDNAYYVEHSLTQSGNYYSVTKNDNEFEVTSINNDSETTELSGTLQFSVYVNGVKCTDGGYDKTYNLKTLKSEHTNKCTDFAISANTEDLELSYEIGSTAERDIILSPNYENTNSLQVSSSTEAFSVKLENNKIKVTANTCTSAVGTITLYDTNLNCTVLDTHKVKVKKPKTSYTITHNGDNKCLTGVITFNVTPKNGGYE